MSTDSRSRDGLSAPRGVPFRGGVAGNGTAKNGTAKNGTAAPAGNGTVVHDLMERVISRAPDGANGRAMGRRKQTRPTVSVVIPALNEAPNLPRVLPLIGTWVDEVLLVDGESVDQTTEVARALWPEIRIVEQRGRGKGAALRSGFEAATGDIIVMLDADGSTDPREIPAFVGLLVAGADLVKGTRFAQGAGTADMSILRRLGNRGLTLAVRLLFGGRFSDLCYGYMAFWKRVLPQLELDADGFEIETQISVRALSAWLKVAEVPSFESMRHHGKSNLRTFPDGWRVLKSIIREDMRRFSARRAVDSCPPPAQYHPAPSTASETISG